MVYSYRPNCRAPYHATLCSLGRILASTRLLNLHKWHCQLSRTSCSFFSFDLPKQIGYINALSVTSLVFASLIKVRACLITSPRPHICASVLVNSLLYLVNVVPVYSTSHTELSLKQRLITIVSRMHRRALSFPVKFKYVFQRRESTASAASLAPSPGFSGLKNKARSSHTNVTDRAYP